MNPYESPPEQQPIAVAESAHEPELDEPSSIRKAFFQFFGVLVILAMAFFLMLLAWVAYGGRIE